MVAADLDGLALGLEGLFIGAVQVEGGAQVVPGLPVLRVQPGGQGQLGGGGAVVVQGGILAPALRLSYKRKVLLYNGTIKPEEFLDRETIKTRDRPELYLIGELYGLGNYYCTMGQPEKGIPLLKECREVPTWHECFAYQQCCNDLAAMGL